MVRILVGLVLLASSGAVAQQPAVGDAVWAQWRPNSWYHGKVGRTCPIGLFINFDDGDKACVPTSLVAKDTAPASIKVGARVLADWHGKQYPGVVAGPGYKIRFDDHDVRNNVPLAQIRKLAGAPARADVPRVGSTVWVQWKPNSIYKGKVARPCAYGLFVNFDDGDKGCFSAAVMAVDAAPKRLQVGARVFARWKGNRFYPGTIRSAPSNGKAGIKFDDNDASTVNLSDMRTIGF